MANSSLTKKLHIKPGQRITIINPPPGYLDELGKLLEGVERFDKLSGKFDFIHLFVKNIKELESFGPKALSALKYDGILWIFYPKKSSKVETDISRDVGWATIRKNGLRPVAAVSIDDVWSALRFRPIDQVGKSRK